MSQKFTFYIKTDIIGSKIIIKDLPEDKVQSAIKRLTVKNTEFFKKYNIRTIKEEGDGVLYEGDDLNIAIKACLELSRENQLNPTTVYAEEKSLAYRFSLKTFIVTGMINTDNPYDTLLAKLSEIEKAVQYPENSVILDKATFELAVSNFKNNKIAYKFIEMETDTGDDTVVNIGYSQEGLSARKPQSLDLDNKFRKSNEEIAKLKKEKNDLENKISSQQKLRISFLVTIAAITIALVFSTYSYTENQIQLEQKIYENQMDRVKASIIYKIQSFIDSAHVLENTIELGYVDGMDKEDFIDQRIDELKKSELYKREKVPIKNSLYFYIMSPHPDCKFLLYSHVEYMKRENGTGLEACESDLDLFITGNYPSTGTGDFTNGIVQKVWLGNEGVKNDLTSVITINWDKFATDIQQSDIYLQNTRFVLVDKEGYSVIECTKEDCESMHEHAKIHGPITAESRYMKFVSEDYSSFDELVEPYDFKSNEFDTYGIVRSSILDGWTLHMYVEQNP